MGTISDLSENLKLSQAVFNPPPPPFFALTPKTKFIGDVTNG